MFSVGLKSSVSSNFFTDSLNFQYCKCKKKKRHSAEGIHFYVQLFELYVRRKKSQQCKQYQVSLEFAHI